MLQAIVLGLVQGLTEFLPVSSSAHLVIVPYLLRWPQPPLEFDVALHAGTLIAVVVYFRSDLWQLLTGCLGVGVDVSDARRARRTLALLAVATVPASVLGLLLQSSFEDVFSRPRLVSVFLLGTGAILWLAEHVRLRRLSSASRHAVARAGAEPLHAGAVATGHDPPAALDDSDRGRDVTAVNLADAVTVGAAQAAAILPGISRSGATIAVGMLRGLSREAAARFSFLLSIPVIVGAIVLQLPALADTTGDAAGYGHVQTLAGMAAAAVSGYVAIRLLLRLVSSESLIGFARYVAVVAVALFVTTFVLGPV